MGIGLLLHLPINNEGCFEPTNEQIGQNGSCKNKRPYPIFLVLVELANYSMDPIFWNGP